MDITIIEKSELFSHPGCALPYYISGRARSPRSMVVSADNTFRDTSYFEAIKNIRVLSRTVAQAIDCDRREVRVLDLHGNETRNIPYDVLVLATGALAHRPDIEGIDERGVYSFYDIGDAEQIRSRLTTDEAKDVCIIGGGLIGVETAESLMNAGARVTILERQQTILSSLFDEPIAARIGREMGRRGIKIITGVDVNKIERQNGILVVSTDHGQISSDLVILSAGVKPNASLAREAGLDIGPAGGVHVDDHLRTSDPQIYAVGDCAETINTISGRQEYWPLGSISTKMGRIAADNIAGRPSSFNGFIGTAMARVFDIYMARTGLTSRAAVESGFDPVTACVSGWDKGPYAGDARTMMLQIVSDRDTRRVIGAQGVGRNVFPRIVAITGAITAKMTLDDVFKLDMGFSPVFNSSIDIVQTACLVVANKLDGLLKTISAEEVLRRTGELTLVDVSPPSEHALGAIEGSINLPLENLRAEDLPFTPEDHLVLYSRTSSGAYEAYRYLISKGFERISVLEGGYLWWKS
jgi:NADPH-dependent 2,4-dienoyl-CoA reductase/sulfur reductase-like enzyme/rhodanese-related sulfurtransferase